MLRFTHLAANQSMNAIALVLHEPVLQSGGHQVSSLILFQGTESPFAYRTHDPTSWAGSRLEQPAWAQPADETCSSLLHLAVVDHYHGLCSVLSCAHPPGGSIMPMHTVGIQRFAQHFTFSPNGQHLAFVNKKGIGLLRGHPAFEGAMVVDRAAA